MRSYHEWELKILIHYSMSVNFHLYVLRVNSLEKLVRKPEHLPAQMEVEYTQTTP